MNVSTEQLQGAPPVISVLIPTYNAARTLERAVISCLKQTESNIEVIILDDVSTDGSFDLAQQLAQKDSRIKIERMAANGGQYAALNHGINCAKGEWVAVLDSDDWMDAKRLERLLTIAKQNQTAMAVDNLAFFDNVAGSYSRSMLPVHGRVTILDDQAFLQRSNPITNNRSDYGLFKPLFHRETILQKNLRYYEVRNCGDYYFLLAYFLAGEKAAYTDETLYNYVEPVGELTRQQATATRKPYPFANFASLNARFIADYQGLLTSAQTRALIKRGKSFLALERLSRFAHALRQRDIQTAIKLGIEAPIGLPLLILVRFSQHFIWKLQRSLGKGFQKCA